MYVLHVSLCKVTSAFTLFRMVLSPPPLSIASKFWNVLPKCHVLPLFSPSVEQKPLLGLLSWECS